MYPPVREPAEVDANRQVGWVAHGRAAAVPEVVLQDARVDRRPDRLGAGRVSCHLGIGQLVEREVARLEFGVDRAQVLLGAEGLRAGVVRRRGARIVAAGEVRRGTDGVE
jgi:hypothetical protein